MVVMHLIKLLQMLVFVMLNVKTKKYRCCCCCFLCVANRKSLTALSCFIVHESRAAQSTMPGHLAK
jgi:hypothetical protein